MKTTQILIVVMTAGVFIYDRECSRFQYVFAQYHGKNITTSTFLKSR